MLRGSHCRSESMEIGGGGGGHWIGVDPEGRRV